MLTLKMIYQAINQWGIRDESGWPSVVPPYHIIKKYINKLKEKQSIENEHLSMMMKCNII